MNQELKRSTYRGRRSTKVPPKLWCLNRGRIHVQIGLKVLLEQTMIDNQHWDRRICTRGCSLLSQDITTAAITTDHVAIGKGGMGKFLYGCLLEIGYHPHFGQTYPNFHRKIAKHSRHCAPAEYCFINAPSGNLLILP